jgi:tetratricopeptide (TPR) repeat protein
MQELSECLRYYKKHTDARNLLGLIYYEIGEVGLAQGQWKLSLYHQPESNQATYYLKEFSERTDAKVKKEAIEKYNQALYSMHTGSKDIAILQIKKAVELNPNFVKAQCLLALMYMQEEKFFRAKKALKKALSVDCENPLVNYYLGQVADLSTLDKKEEKEVKREEKHKERVQAGSFSPNGGVPISLMRSCGYIFSGIVLGCIVAWCVLFPSVKQKLIESNNDSIAVYSKQISSKDTEIVSLNAQIDELTEAKANAEKTLKAYTSKNGIIDTYDNMLSCLKNFIDDDYLEAYNSFSKLKRKDVDDSVYRKVYDSLKEEFSTNAEDKLYEKATALYKKRNFTEAIPYYLACLDINADNPQCMYWLALSYHNSGDKETANKYYDKLIKEYSSTFYGKQAKVYRR